MMATDYARRIFVRVTALASAMVILVLAAISLYALGLFERHLQPEIERKSFAVAETIARQVEHAVVVGVPFDRLVGMPEFLGGLVRHNPDVDYIAVTDAGGRLLYHSGDAVTEQVTADLDRAGRRLARFGAYYDTVSVMRDGRGAEFGIVHVGMSTGFVREQMEDIFADVLTVVLVSLLVTVEVLLVVVALFAESPLILLERLMRDGIRGDFTRFAAIPWGGEFGRLARAINAVVERLGYRARDLRYDAADVRAAQMTPAAAQAVDTELDNLEARFTLPRERLLPAPLPNSVLRVRIPLFVFLLAEELTRPFLPLYTQALHRPSTWLSPEMAACLPISAFMLVVALLSPFAAGWNQRWGTRRVMLSGSLPAVAGFLGSATSPDVAALVGWRMLGAAGYAVIYVACQDHMVRCRGTEEQGRGFKFFLGAVFAAAVCGPAVGGILAERVGVTATFQIAAGIAALAALLGVAMFRSAPETAPQPRERRAAWPLLRNPRFLAVAILSGIPAQAMLTGVIFFVAPLLLSDLGAEPATIGRMLMLYGLVALALTPVFTGIGDRIGQRGAFIAVGGAVAGLGVLVPAFDQSAPMMLTAIAAIGVAQAVAAIPRMALIENLCGSECRRWQTAEVLRVFRLIERVGGVVGPLMMAVLLQSHGYAAALGGAALLSLLATGMFVAIGRRPPREARP